MEEKKKKDPRDEELDRFWDIDALIPKRILPPTASDTDTAEIVLESVPRERREGEKTEAIPSPDSAKRRYIPPHTAEEFANRPKADLEYVPENALIRKICVYRIKGNYR